MSVERIQVSQLVHDLCTATQNAVKFGESFQSVLIATQLLVTYTYTQTHIHTYRQTDRQTDRQTCIHSDIERQRFQSIQLVVAKTLGTCRSVSLTAQ